MFSSTSALSPDPRQENHKPATNRKRNGYELTRQRSMLPVALGAALATLLIYAVIYQYDPSIPFRIRGLADQPEAKVEYERVIVRKPPEEEMEKPKETQETPVEDDKPEIIETKEPQEIVDVLDAKIDSIIIAPGYTDLSIPAPVTKAEEAATEENIKPVELADNLLNTPAVPPEAVAIPEPTPINANEVMVRATAQLEELEGADGVYASELNETARESEGSDLPDDTRTLAELIGESNLGAGSGVARLGSDLLFGFNECKLKGAARVTMLQLAALIEKNPNTYFIIEGHTDSIGGNAYNALLSMQRAAAVREWLRGNKITTDKVYIRACSYNTPLADTKGNREQQAINRRVEIHMRKADEPLPEGCEDHNYKVDLHTKLGTQLHNGVVIPKTYPSASASLTPEQKAQAAPARQKAKQKQQRKQKSANNQNRRRAR
ncbi:MAG: OmpA family protein [Akkermansia sp.]|nr:OmpA family protein [Akkermansia sp.]